MPQKTNLNISPYYDDFDKDNNFYKVLFKPGHPVQARELTTLQTMLQEQVSSFGSHIFKEGSMVIPGSLNYDPEYYSVKINAEHQGIPVSLYAEKLKGIRLTGQNSGVTVTIDNYALASSSVDVTDLTLYIKYLGSGGDNQVKTLEDGEELITEESFVYGNTAVNVGNTVATLISLNASAIGCAVGITTGVYFIRGTFVDVAEDKIVLDPYTNTPSYRVGLNILEEIVTAKEDDSLYDNARGYSNYAAPGADRLKISTVLSKKPLSDFNDKSFVELIKLDNGEVKKLQNKSQYSIIKDYFAKRTFEESGDYSVGNFGVEVKNSLNDGISNEGIYLSSQVTDQQNTPSDDVHCVKISAGKAYVRGYDVDKGGTTVLDVDKPRDKRNVDNALIAFDMGSLLRVNNVSGTPVVGLNNNDARVNFHNQRKNSTTSANGTFIGSAKVYSFNLSDAPYVNASSEWDLYLYDIQTFTGISFNTAISNVLCPNNTRVRGLKSGAIGYVTVHSGATTSVKYLSETSGTFLVGEDVILNEDPSLKRTLTVVTPFGIQDMVSVYYDVSAVSGYNVDFSADVVLKEENIKNWRITDKATITSGGVITSATGADFTSFKVGNHVSYSIAGLSTASYGEVTAIAADGSNMTISACTDVIGVADGSLPGSTIESSIKVLRSEGISNENKGLYAPLDSTNISDLNLSNSNLMITKQITGESSDGTGKLEAASSAIGLSSSFFESFDAERYGVFFASGAIAPIDSGNFTLENGGGNIKIDGITANQTNIVVNVTAKKVGLVSKQKNFLRSEKVTINQTIVGVSTVITGLSTSQWYGTRVQDEEISLNVPDVANVVGVYESLNTSDPILDRLTFISGLGLDTNTVLGEKIIGSDSGAVAQLTAKTSATEVEIAYLNSNKFTIGETVTFEESNIVTDIQSTTLGSYLNITDGFNLNKGQKEQFYDYSRLVRKKDFLAPARRITVVYNAFDVPTNDAGDVYTVESYADERYGKDIPVLDSGVRASDIIDFRPRVAKFTATDKSPFALSARSTWQTGGATLVPQPQESSLIGYQHYLPRIDKLVLDIDGNFSVIKGISAVNPKEPTNIEGAMDIALIHLPGYLYNPEDAIVRVKDNRRYTMRDIGRLEDRVDTIETVTSLSLLELDTKTLQVNDATGISRFKSGFFVDDFKDINLLDLGNAECSVDIDGNKREMNVPLHLYSLKPELALESSIDTSTADFSANLDLLDPNVQKTGDLITLKYDEVEWLEQPLASRVENVNPFNMIDFQGRVGLLPESDSWIRDVYVSGGTRNETGDRDFEWIETIKISSNPDTHMRSRNVGFEAGGLKPVTRYYPFFDSTSGIDLVPKLLEITMNSGVFTVGERVAVYGDGKHCAEIRVLAPNHKGGNINNVATTFNANPYNTSITLPTTYSASSTVLNIDVRSLTDDAQGDYWGYIPNSTSTVLIGRSSGAEARVSNVRLITDTYGDVGGAWWFRDPLASPPPTLRFTTGTKNFKLSSSSTNATPLPGSLLISSAETTYSSNGIVDTYRQTQVIVRRPPPPPPPPPGHRGGGKDPLAQSFTVDETGAFLTSVDLFFGSKDPSEKIVVEVRTVELGTPTDQVVADYARVTLEPSQINISATGETATKVTFPSPIYLQPREEYAIVLLSPSSDNYEAWIARMGERTVNTQSLPDAESVMVTRQYTGGSLFKSQNGTIWSPSQFEDLKFKLYKAKFTSNVGTVHFFNPSLGTNNNNVPRLLSNAVRTLPRKLRVDIDNIIIVDNPDLVAMLSPGRKVSEGATSATTIRPTGYIEKAGGSISGVSITNASSGYKTGTYNASATKNIDSDGTGAIFNITVNASGAVSAAAIATAGDGYLVGDVLTVDNSTVPGIAGIGAEITVTGIDQINTLYLTNVQGEHFTTGQDLVWYDDAGARVAAASTNIENSTVWPNNLYSGNVLEVNQYNHGMGASNNKVSLANISPNTAPQLLTANLATSDTSISVASTTPFATYQGITTDGGYVQVNDEIIQYNSIGSGTLGIAARGLLGSLTRSHNINDACYSYELNGIGLTAINTTFDLPSDTDLMNAKDIHKYHLQVTRPDNRDSGDDMVNFTDENSLGESDIFASQNFQFNGIQPQFNVITPGEKTSVSSKIRTVSGTSAGGSEVSFIDQGYESVELNQLNKLDSTRMICSQVNETARLNTLPKNRSTTLAIQFNSEDENLSPVLDTATGSLILQRSLVNQPISDYVTDDRSNKLIGDPHSAVYISKKVNLKQPATSLKVLVGAYRHSSADFRVLYQLHRQGSNEVDQSYELFPGYDNLRDTDGDGFGDTVINESLDSGRADAVVSSSRDDEFKEYQFSVEGLDTFVGFSIKIVANGTNEAYAPRFKDLRVLALA
tara:strand:- start:7554 stop:14672 length:7119 start_codon:yes stop_codon:yes gene_type:complete